MAGSDEKTKDGESEKATAIVGGYQLLQRVGRGGMGTVYKAKQLSVDRIVAVKILRPALARNQSFIERFREEAKAAAKLNHPNVVQAIDSGEESGYYYFAMEYVDGETMHREMLRDGMIDEKRALRIALDVARALEHAQAHQIVHRDIKPGNIMLSRDGVTKLCDLGLARAHEEDDESMRGAAIGTPFYISPEQAMGQTDVDCRSDIYSLGATLYRAVVGKPAFDAPTKQEILEKHVRSPLPWPKDHNPALSDNVCYLIAKMMAKKPSERYQTPVELEQDIERILEGQAPKSSVVQLEMPPVRLTEAERKQSALTQARIQKKMQGVRELAEIREMAHRVAAEQSVPAHSIVRLLRGNLDETKADTFLKFGLLLLAENRPAMARVEFRNAAKLGADVSEYMAKIDALGTPPGMKYIPAGEFQAGPPDALTKASVPAFYIDAQLVTNADYFKFLKSVPNAPTPAHWLNREIPDGQAEMPIVNVTWEEARAYAEWKGKRLPTAAEWQKAARGTDGRRYPWGNDFDPRRCNTSESGIGDMTVAGRYPKGVSPYGCNDMIGNVVQWCQDEGPTPEGDKDGRAVCGVSWEEPGEGSGCWRVEFRKRMRRSRKCGFRCAMSL